MPVNKLAILLLNIEKYKQKDTTIMQKEDIYIAAYFYVWTDGIEENE